MEVKVIEPILKNSMVKKKVCAYARVSTDSLEQEDSLDNQTSYYQTYIESNPEWEFAGIYSDQGISGFKEKRPGFQQDVYKRQGKELDYLSDYTAYSLQSVEYGKNLLDVKINRDHTERYTALIPLGAKIVVTDEEGNETESEERVSIAGVNGGVNYVYDEAAVKEIGWIWKTEIWEDVTVPGNLLTKSKSRIMELAKGITSMELTIVDESDTGADIGDIRARQYVYCKSPPHGIDGRYLCMGKTTDYMNPAGNTITIGASGITLTSISAKQNENLSTYVVVCSVWTAVVAGIGLLG